MQRFALTALIPILALACDIDDETSTRIGEGHVGAGLSTDDADELDLLDDFTDALDPAQAGWCDDVATWNSSWKAFEVEVIALINKRRAAGASCGGVWRKPVPAVIKHDKLRCAARKHSKDMGVADFTSHTGSNGSSPWDRIHAAGYNYTSAAENIAWGYSTPAAVVDAWMKSTGHCNNIMAANLEEIGVGYYYSGSHWKHLWTQDFGTKP